MNKDFTQTILLEFEPRKQIKILNDLAIFIENKKLDTESGAFQKLAKYHSFLDQSSDVNIQKLNREFAKVKANDFQFQVYRMNLERLLGQSSKEYQFLVDTNDNIGQERVVFPIVCILDSIRSAHNVGAIFRSSECFGVNKIFTCGLTPSSDSEHVKKTAMGAELLVPNEHRQSALDTIIELKSQGYKVWAIETVKDMIDLNEISTVPQKLALVFGHEQFGVSKEVLEACERAVPIKLFGIKNSLNVSISHGIVLNKLTSLFYFKK